MTRPRKDDILREVKECPIHGRTEFARYFSGPGASYSSKCMKCENERSVNYQNRTDQTRVVPTISLSSSKRGDICERCFNEKSLSGVCDFCA